jgi:hypothetical protein
MSYVNTRMNSLDSEISRAMCTNNCARLRELLRANPDVWYITKNYESDSELLRSTRYMPLLCYALEEDVCDEVIQTLIDLQNDAYMACVKTHSPSENSEHYGYDALHIAVLRRNSYFVSAHLEMGLAKPENMDALFDFAVSKGNNTDVLVALMDAGWHHDMTMSMADLLMKAMSYDNFELSLNFETILRYVTDPNILNAPVNAYQGPNRLLHRAVQMRQPRRERALLAAGADPAVVDQHGRLAEWYRSDEAVQEMDGDEAGDYDDDVDSIEYGWVNHYDQEDSETPAQPNTLLHVPADLSTAEAIYEWMCENAVNVRDDCDPITMEAWKELPYETLKTTLLLRTSEHHHAFLLTSLQGLIRSGQPMNPINRVPLTTDEIRYIRSYSA